MRLDALLARERGEREPDRGAIEERVADDAPHVRLRRGREREDEREALRVAVEDLLQAANALIMALLAQLLELLHLVDQEREVANLLEGRDHFVEGRHCIDRRLDAAADADPPKLRDGDAITAKP